MTDAVERSEADAATLRWLAAQPLEALQLVRSLAPVSTLECPWG
jgi:hypothetical protein